MALSALDVLLGLRLDEQGRTWGERATEIQRRDAEAILDADSRTPYHALWRSRGYSKTTDLGAVAIAVLLAQAPPGSRSYAAASDQAQARLLLDSIEQFVRLTPGLARQLKVDAWKVTAPNGATLEALAADEGGSFGLRPYFTVVDEIAEWGETTGPKRIWTALTTGAPKVGGRLVSISVAGSPSHWSREVYEHAQADPLWRLSDVPGPAPWLDPVLVEEQRRRLPEGLYRRYYENRWVSADDVLVSADLLRELVRHGPAPEPRAGHRYVAGLDVGQVNDPTAFVVVHSTASYEEPPEPQRVTNDTSPAISFLGYRKPGEPMPEETPLTQRLRLVVDEIKRWRGTRDDPLDLDLVEDYVADAALRYPSLRVEVDPSGGGRQLVTRLQRRGVSAGTFDFTTKSVGRLAESLVLLLNERAIELPDDPALLEELSHVRLRESSPGVVRLDHTSGRHDDQAVALALACRPLAQDGIVRSMVMASVGVDDDRPTLGVDPLGPLHYSMGL